MSQFPYQSPQPAWIEGRTAESAERERSFFQAVYGWMFVGLMLTTLASTLVVFSPMLQRLVVFNPIVWIALSFAEIGLVFYASARLQRLTPQTAAICFLAFSFLTGLTLSVILFVYTATSIISAFGAAAGIFAAMSIWARTTSRDISGWGHFLMMGVIGLVISMVINIFVGSWALNMTIGSIGVLIFTGLTAYKTQMLRRFAYAGGAQGQTYAIYGALSLYITFINLFLMLLRLFGGRRR